MNAVLSQVELVKHIVDNVVTYFSLLVIVSYYLLAGIVMVGMIEYITNSLIQNGYHEATRANTDHKYTPRSRITWTWPAKETLIHQGFPMLQNTITQIVLAPLHGVIYLIGSPIKPRRIQQRKVRRHTPKQSFLTRTRWNPDILQSIKVLRQKVCSAPHLQILERIYGRTLTNKIHLSTQVRTITIQGRNRAQKRRQYRSETKEETKTYPETEKGHRNIGNQKPVVLSRL
jgi:hypothetical protein